MPDDKQPDSAATISLDLAPEIASLVQQATEAVHSAYGATLDFDEPSLAFLDALLANELADLEQKNRQELLWGIGACFGEIARRRLGARWAIRGTDPRSWRIETEACFLHFCPVGMAGECLVGCESEQFDGAFCTSDDLRDELDERLRAAPPFSPAEYFSLSGRLEVLTLVADWLVAKQLVSDEGPRTFGPEDYVSQSERPR